MDTVKIGESIAEARKKKNFTQEDLAEEVGVSVQAVSKWENGRNLPDIENLLRIAEVTNVPYSYLIDAGRDNEDDIGSMAVRDRLFQEDNMFTRVRSFAQSEKLSETYQALQYMRVHHAGQVRDKAKYSTEDVKYINHPLLMACQAHAFGVRDDQLLAAILLHDVVEQSEGKIKVMDLPFSDEVKELVRLVTFTIPTGKTQDEAEDEYYRKISDNKKASVIKVIDRCSNVSTMAGSFDIQRMKKYILETERYIIPMLEKLRRNYPEYSDLAFLVKYQITSILETVKYLIIK